MNRTIAIVGRPNVGKSAIFNRLVRKRISIVHEQEGVTRDRVSSEARWGEQRYELIDTGGLAFIDEVGSKDVITVQTRNQARVAIEDADVILLVVDVTAGIVPLDRQVAQELHKSGRPVLTLANKADNDAVEKGAAVFAELGFPVFAVSALHNRGFEPAMDLAVAKLPPPGEEKTAGQPLRVAVVGRPNAGKSSYINRLLCNDRVIVSDIPGTTRDSIEVPFTVGKGPQARHYILIDTAGMRQQRRVDTALEKFSMIRAEKSIEDADVVVLVMDAEQGPSAQDKKIAAKVNECRKGCFLLLNKWDLVTGPKPEEYEKEFRRFIPFMNFAPLVFASTKTGMNMRKSVEMIDHVAGQISMQLTTGTLNRVLHAAVQKVQPPMVQGKRMKFYYASQTGTQPIRIKLFVNDPKRITDAYRLYLLGMLRKAYGLEGAPVVLECKSSHGA